MKRSSSHVLGVVIFLSLATRLMGQVPTISSFSPEAGPIGSTVTIAGTNFSATTTDNTVYFGSVRAIVTVATTSQLTVTVPAGASFKPIMVIVNGLTAYSAKPFGITFTGGGFIDGCSFLQQTLFATGPAPYGSVIADFDGDGKPDVGIANRLVPSISLYRNTSTVGTIDNNTFASPFDLTVASGDPFHLAYADMDGDGMLDIIVTRVLSIQLVSVYRNTSTIGSFSFDPPVDFAAGNDAITAMVSDLDGDGRTDLAFCNRFSNSISIYRNIASPGSFTTASLDNKIDVATGSDPHDLASADLDSDGIPEIVVINRGDNTFSVFKNNSTPGTLSFASAVDFATGASPFGLQLADLNLDNKPEVIVSNHDGASISVFPNIGTGPISLSSFGGSISTSAGFQPGRIAVADVDGDGLNDIMVPALLDNQVSVIRNTTSTGSITLAGKVGYVAGGDPLGISVGDIDGDGKPDVLVTNTSGSSFSLYRNIVGEVVAPTITSVSPASGAVGTLVTITGTDLITPFASYVSFNGTAANIGGISSTTLFTIVPSGATTGPIEYSTGCYSATSPSNFVVIPVPTINSFTPSSGLAGATVVISGTNFDPVPGNNTVKFNGTLATVTASTATTITTTIPAGATSGVISVSTTVGTATSTNPFIITIPYSPSGNVVQLNGTNDRIEVADNVGLRPSSLTVEVWVQFASVPSFAALVSKSQGAATNNSYAIWYESGRLAAGVNVVSVASGMSTIWTPSVNEWYHVALTYDNVSKAEVLYINGLAVATRIGSNPSYDGESLMIGADKNFGSFGGFLPGKIDDVRLWSTPRSSAEIQSTINSVLTGNEAGLVANYKMDEIGQGSGISVKNNVSATGNALNGITFGTVCSTPIFSVLSLPTISSFTPTSGVPGTVVTITGTNFTSPFTNSVTFNGVNAAINSTTATTIDAIVPVGVSDGPIKVTIGCNSVTSGINFLTCSPPGLPVVSGGSGCTNSTVSLNASGAAAGQEYRWYDVSSGGTSLSNSGSFTTPALSVTTNYYVSLFQTTGGCEGPRASVTATIVSPPNPPTVSDASRCDSGSVALAASGGVNGNYRWYTAGSGGTAIAGEVNSAFNTGSITSTTDYFVSINNGSCESTRTKVIATITPSPSAPSITNATRCDVGTVTLAASGGANGEYRWYAVPSGGIPLSGEVNNTFSTGSLTATTSFYVSINNGICESSRTTVIATINSIPAKPVITLSGPATFCQGGSVTLTATNSASYLWSDGNTSNPRSVSVSIASATVRIKDVNGCDSPDSDPVTIVVNPRPATPVITSSKPISNGSVALCNENNETTTLGTTASASSYLWSNGQTSPSFTTGQGGLYSLQVTDANGCSSLSSSGITITRVNCAPTISTATIQATLGNAASLSLISLITTAGTLDVASITVVKQPASGATASVNNGVLKVDYSGISFAGTETVTVRACDVNGNCSTQEFTIEVNGDLIVYNAISPNNDRSNETFLIQYIDVLPDTKNNSVLIYNRWGDLVWEADNYDNSAVVFRGLNQSGSLLPAGTYYYKIRLPARQKTLTGYIELKH